MKINENVSKKRNDGNKNHMASDIFSYFFFIFRETERLIFMSYIKFTEWPE